MEDEEIKFGTDHFKYMVEYANQRVIEELQKVLKSNMDIKGTPFISAINVANLNLANRIKELKQD